jgi:hypothetical protein
MLLLIFARLEPGPEQTGAGPTPRADSRCSILGLGSFGISAPAASGFREFVENTQDAGCVLVLAVASVAFCRPNRAG